MATAPNYSRSLDLGRVFARTFRLVRDNWARVGGFIVVMMFVYAIVFGLMATALMPIFAAMREAQALGTAPDFSNVTGLGWLFIALGYGFIIILASVMVAGAVYGFSASTLLRKVSVGECLSVGFRKGLPLLLKNFVLGILIGIGRSQKLTEGSRLMILVIYIAWYVLLFFGLIAFEIVALILIGVIAGFAAATGGGAAAVVVGLIVGLLLFVAYIVFVGGFFLLQFALPVAIYQELRMIKGEAGAGAPDSPAQSLEDIFS